MNKRNLIPVSSRSPEQRRELARKAGKASAKKRRKNKSLREIMNELLALPLNPDDPTDRDILKWLDVDGDPDYWEGVALNKKLGICAALVRLATKGNIRATILTLKIVGEYPAEKVEIRYRDAAPKVIYKPIKIIYEDSAGKVLKVIPASDDESKSNTA